MAHDTLTFTLISTVQTTASAYRILGKLANDNAWLTEAILEGTPIQFKFAQDEVIDQIQGKAVLYTLSVTVTPIVT